MGRDGPKKTPLRTAKAFVCGFTSSRDRDRGGGVRGSCYCHLERWHFARVCVFWWRCVRDAYVDAHAFLGISQAAIASIACFLWWRGKAKFKKALEIKSVKFCLYLLLLSFVVSVLLVEPFVQYHNAQTEYHVVRHHQQA